MSNWTEADNYTRYYLPTDDPRVLAVIERDEEPHAPDGDALAPAFYVEYRGGYRVSKAGDTFQDDESEALAERWVEARDHFRHAAGYRHDGLSIGLIVRSEEVLERWLRIFYQESYALVERQDATVLLLDTQGFRSHVGIEADAPSDLSGESKEWEAYLDGEVYGVGYAVNTERVLDDGEEIDLDDFEVTIECWGFYGEDYAKETAARFDYGKPELPEMLPLHEVVCFRKPRKAAEKYAQFCRENESTEWKYWVEPVEGGFEVRVGAA